MTLFAAWLLAARCYKSREARGGAVALLAVWLTLPIAGTSLMLMDPYVTARSLSTPCGLLALVGALQFLLPGLMEGERSRRRWRGLALCCGAHGCGGDDASADGRLWAGFGAAAGRAAVAKPAGAGMGDGGLCLTAV